MKHTWSWLLVLGVAGGCAGTDSGREPSPAPANASEQDFEVVQLKHVAAIEIVRTLNELLDASRWAIAHPNEVCPPKLDTWSDRYDPDRRPGCLPWNIVADPRTNSIVFSSADPVHLPRLLELIAKLDVETPKRPRQPSGEGHDHVGYAVEVVRVRYASAVELASTLNELLEASRRAVRHHGCALPKPGMENEVHRDDL